MHHLHFQLQLQAKDVDLEQMKEAREKAEEELMEKESAWQKELREHGEEKKRLEEKHQQEVNLSSCAIRRLEAIGDALNPPIRFSFLPGAGLEFELGEGALCAALQPGRRAEETDHAD